MSQFRSEQSAVCTLTPGRCDWPREPCHDRSPPKLAAIPAEANAGFTLLGVILSLAILAGSLAALGEVMRLADRNARCPRRIAGPDPGRLDHGRAALRLASSLPPSTRQPFDYEHRSALGVFDRVRANAVRRAGARCGSASSSSSQPELQPAQFELVRWMPNPDYIAARHEPAIDARPRRHRAHRRHPDRPARTTGAGGGKPMSRPSTSAVKPASWRRTISSMPLRLHALRS